MKSKVFILLFTTLSLFAQSFVWFNANDDHQYYECVTVFEDHFDDNRHFWKLDTRYSEATIQNGVMELVSLGERSDIRVQSLERFLGQHDYEIETSIKIIGESSYSNSIVWGTTSTGGYYEQGLSFGFDSQQRFITLETRDWAAYDLTSWTQSSAIQQGEFNKITIRKKGHEHLFFINDVLLVKTVAQPLLGANFGIHVANGATIQVDYLKAKVYLPRA